MKNIFLHIQDSNYSIEDLVLATVVKTAGSTPQKAGSSALFNGSELLSGTIGGGVLEGKIASLTGKAAKSKKSGLYRFRLDNSSPSGEDALCGGSVSVLIDPELAKHVPALKRSVASISARMTGVMMTMVSNIYAESVIIDRFWVTSADDTGLSADVSERVMPEILDMIGKSDPYDFREMEFTLPEKEAASVAYLQSVVPPPRLVIAGAGHIGKALSVIAQMLDFDVTVVDDRKEFANSQNLTAADHIMVGDIGAQISGVDKGRDTFIVIVTRGHRDDANALRACIGSDAAYIGMIGSRNKILQMRQEFIANKWATEDQWKKIYAPVGMEINSKSVEEIAVSIAAQLVQVRNSEK